jgi:outer membrane protein assembly factor BamD|tara:strand:- start:365 stop:1213 length:849 start_codon:yes stop_codon:yes gene_type:complete
MERFKIFLFFIIIILTFFSCSKENLKDSVINEISLDKQVFEAYMEGKKSLEEGDVLFAAKKFNEAEMLFPQSDWAPKAALMAAYAYYRQDYYGDVIAEVNRFIKVYPQHPQIDYAYYLLAITYYEQIIDEKKDLGSILKAKKTFKFILENYPETEYALDSEFKLDLINEILAAKEIYIGRYYFDKKKWIPAINRFRTVIDNYHETIYVEEALHRLVEAYFVIGLKDESRKYAKLLGYNYQSSKWYEKSYSLFNKNYSENQKKLTKKSKKSNIVIRKFKSLLE